MVVAEKYREIGAWCESPYFEEESLNNLMDVMESAGELDERVPYDKVVDMSVADKVIEESN